MPLEACTYLNRLAGLYQRLVRVRYVVEGNAVELTLVDVRDPVVLSPLGSADRCLQVVFETVRRVAGTDTKG